MAEFKMHTMNIAVAEAAESFWFQTNNGWDQITGLRFVLYAGEVEIHMFMAGILSNGANPSYLASFLEKSGGLLMREDVVIDPEVGIDQQVADEFLQGSVVNFVLQHEADVAAMLAADQQMLNEFVAVHGPKPERL